jgi:hypothetical protein
VLFALGAVLLLPGDGFAAASRRAVNRPARPCVEGISHWPHRNRAGRGSAAPEGVRGSVGIAALITWFGAILAGLYMLAVWLIENDVTSRHAAPSQLPVPVIVTHLLLAMTGLVVWAAYLLLDREILAWAAFGLLAVVVLLGLTMFARWIPVYREPPPVEVLHAMNETLAVPAEGNFPVAVIAAHGLLAGSTLVLVFLTALGVGGS